MNGLLLTEQPVDFAALPQLPVGALAVDGLAGIADGTFLSLGPEQPFLRDCALFGSPAALDVLRRSLPWGDRPVALGAYAFRDSIVSAATLVVERDGAALCARQTLPAWGFTWIREMYCDPASQRLGHLRAGLHNGRIRTVDRPVIVAMHHNWVYGHFLLEMVGRLFIARRLMEADPGARPLLALPNQAPGWVHDILRACFAEDELLRYDAEQEVLRAPLVLVPTMLMDEHAFAPAYLDAVAWLQQAVLGAVPPAPRTARRAVFLARRQHRGQQGIANEAAVIDALAARGVEIYEPQLHPFADQLRRFAATDLLIGDFNSALHNSIFMAPGSTVLMLNFFSHYQTGLCAARGQRLGLFLPADGRCRTWELRGTPDAWYQVDVPGLCRFLEAEQLV